MISGSSKYRKRVSRARSARTWSRPSVAAISSVSASRKSSPTWPTSSSACSSRRSRIASIAARAVASRWWDEEQPVAGVLERRGLRSSPVDAVVRECALQARRRTSRAARRRGRRVSAGTRAGAPAGCAAGPRPARRSSRCGRVSARRSAYIAEQPVLARRSAPGHTRACPSTRRAGRRRSALTSPASMS